MFLVVSKWQITPGKEAEAEERGRNVRRELRSIPGIEFVRNFRNESGEVIAVMGYSDPATYQRIVQDPQGQFEQTIAKHGLEEVATWVSSDRGEELDE
jgi:hypothetical protein